MAQLSAPGESRVAEQTLDQPQNNIPRRPRQPEAPLQTSGSPSATESQLSFASEFHGVVFLALYWLQDLLGKPRGSWFPPVVIVRGTVAG